MSKPLVASYSCECTPITIGAAPGHIVVTLAGNIQELPAVISIAVIKSGNHLPKARTVGTQSRS